MSTAPRHIASRTMPPGKSQSLLNMLRTNHARPGIDAISPLQVAFTAHCRQKLDTADVYGHSVSVVKGSRIRGYATRFLDLRFAHTKVDPFDETRGSLREQNFELPIERARPVNAGGSRGSTQLSVRSFV
jgi:hypothetical protein